VAETTARALDPAARRRVNQRKKQRFTRRVHRFESFLPAIKLPALRPALPALDFGRPLRWLARARMVWLSLLVAVALAALVAWVHLDEYWFIYTEDAQFNNLTYLERDELWQLAELDGWNVFWIDAAAVRERVMSHPYVDDATVRVAPFAAKVTVDIVPERPVALWVTDAGTRWLLDDGTALEPRGETLPGLLEIIDLPASATMPGSALGTAMDPAVLASAQGVANRLPGAAPLRYNQQIGLNFRLPDKPFWVYWGDGGNVEQKLENLAVGEQLLADGRLEGEVIDVRFDRPYVK
jgi:cell division protein FtsQ